MKTQQLTRSALLCALYGLILLLNSMSALSVETYLPWLMCLPIMVCASLYPPIVSLAALAAMALMTLMFGTMTTWLNAGSFLAAGFIFGWCVYRRKNPMISCLAAFAILFVCNYLQVTVFAALFGYDPAEAQAIANMLPGHFSWQSIVAVMAVFLSFMQTIVIYCLSILLLGRLHIQVEKLRLPAWQEISRGWVWAFCISLAGLLLLAAGWIPVWLSEIMMAVFLVSLVVMVYAGTQVLLEKMQKKAGSAGLPFFPVFLLLCTAFIPGLDLVHAAFGCSALLTKSKGSPDHPETHKEGRRV